jgi:hypothetical protein
MIKYIVIFHEETVQGFYNRDELEGATFDLEWGEDYKVFDATDVRDAIKDSDLDPRDKQSLTLKLNQEDVEFD